MKIIIVINSTIISLTRAVFWWPVEYEGLFFFFNKKNILYYYQKYHSGRQYEIIRGQRYDLYPHKCKT